MSKLGNWYYLDRERLKDYDVLKIKKELIESPNSFGLTIADKENMVLYREDSEYFRVPRQYGLDTFGEPDERDLVEGWEIDCNFNGTLDETKHQITLTDQFMSRVPKTVGGILCSGPGCHAKGQGILMHDGTVKNVEDIQVGDQLHGMDYKPRTVYSLCRGRDTMVRIVPVKGKSFVVNINHILTLVRSKNDREYDGEIVDVSVKGWMEWGSRKKSV